MTARDGVCVRRWTNQTWCPSVVEPEWPFAYSKFQGQGWERKGRSNPDKQDDRHECATHGVESKCHRCERITCGARLDAFCEYELQGVSHEDMSVNIPTANDAPWAVNGSHRYDQGRKRVIQRRFNVGVLEAIPKGNASTL